jgi:DNA-binding MarR family transcriptional regulator
MVDMADADDAPLGYLLHRTEAALRPEVSAALRPLHLSLAEFVCMRKLSGNPGSSNAELSRCTGVSPQAMNAVLRRLEELGAVTRPASVSSGRALAATLTRDGQDFLTRAEAAVREADDRILAALTPAQQREFKCMLATLGTD